MRLSLRVFLFVSILQFPLHGMTEDLPYTFECDSANGRVSQVLIPLPKGSVEVTGNLVMNEVRSDERWASGANIMLHRPGEDSDLGLRLAFVDPGSKEATVVVQDSGSNSGVSAAVIPQSSEPILFKIVLSAEGGLSVFLSGEVLAHKAVATKPSHLSLACTTGDYSFRSVKVVN